MPNACMLTVVKPAVMMTVKAAGRSLAEPVAYDRLSAIPISFLYK